MTRMEGNGYPESTRGLAWVRVLVGGVGPDVDAACGLMGEMDVVGRLRG